MKIAAVVVTYNRLHLLKEALESFNNQSRVVDYIIVVNNASTDGTDIFLKNWKNTEVSGMEKIVITLEENLGGSGGFYFGTEKALSLDADWIWVSDDDAIPNKDVFEKAEKHILDFEFPDNVSAICAQVQMDGVPDVTHRKKIKKSFFRVYQENIVLEEYSQKSFPLDSISYVGTIMNRHALEKIGLINKDYFIWQDDMEHSIRLKSVGKLYCYPDMIVDHRTTKSDYVEINWKNYYGYRNDLLMLKEHYPKRYFWFKVMRILQKSVCSKNYVHIKLGIAAICGGIQGEKGLNKLYRPGWKY